MSKSVENKFAREMRKEGKSIKHIAKMLKVSVSSVSVWCNDIVLSPEQIHQLEVQARDPHYGKRLEYINKIKKDKEEKIKQLKLEGIKKIGKLSKRELFLVGSSLYWAEGFKKDKQIGFANQDPKMIKIYIKWLLDCFDLDISDLTLRVTLNKSHQERINEIQQYWSNITNVPVTEFKKPTYQNFTWKKTYENPNGYYGVLRIKVKKSLDNLRRIHGFIEGIKLNI